MNDKPDNERRPPAEPDNREQDSPMSAEPSEAGWNILYVGVIALVIVSLILVLGLVNFGVAVNTVIYILTLGTAAFAVVHWLSGRAK